MCRKLLVRLALITALVIPVGVFVASAKAVSQPTCSSIDFAGWNAAAPGAGGFISASVTDYGNAVQSGTSGNVRGEVRVDNAVSPETATMSAYVEAGVVTTTSGDRLFIEYKNATGSAVYTDEGPASTFTAYAARVTVNSINNSTGYWGFTAQIGSHSITVSVYDAGFPFDQERVTLENQQNPSGSLCNAANTQFTSVSPNIVNGGGGFKNDTSETKFSQLYDHASASFVAYSPWVGTPCNPPGPCLPTG